MITYKTVIGKNLSKQRAFLKRGSPRTSLGGFALRTCRLAPAKGISGTCTYSNTQWIDLLTAYNGNTITYDSIGYPLTYYNGTKFTWEKGRRLAKATNTAENLIIDFKYDVDGNRIEKNVVKNGDAGQ